MPSQEEKTRRKALQQAAQQSEKDAIRSSLPVPPAEMRKLFDYLDEELGEADCDDTLRITLAYLDRKQLPTESVVAWLQKAGGYCDCEVLANAEEQFLSAFPDQEST